jgi:dTDP-4-dehydrorhamnose 3,5-epimerase
MEFLNNELDGICLIKPDVFEDNRGFFLESYSKIKFMGAGIDVEFVQDNHSRSEDSGVLRGLHFQKPPFAQSKLVRVVRGSIFDVVVDLRKKSPTFGMWRGFELTDKNRMLLFVPKGFAHGFCTLVPGTEVQYKVDEFYAPAHDAGIRWDDPKLKITWPVEKPVLSSKDSVLPFLDEIDSPF